MQDFLLEIMDRLGYGGIALLMLVENIIPPIPSEVVMPAAGGTARQGKLSFIGVVLAGFAGSMAGALPWYYVARRVGTERLKRWMDRHGHWFGADGRDIERANAWFDRWGAWAVVLGRLVPGVRTIISVPAGFAEMPLAPFLTCTAIGTGAWTLLLAAIGWWLKGHETVAQILQYIGAGVVALLLAWFVTRVVRRRRAQRSQQ